MDQQAREIYERRLVKDSRLNIDGIATWRGRVRDSPEEFDVGREHRIPFLAQPRWVTKGMKKTLFEIRNSARHGKLARTPFCSAAV